MTTKKLISIITPVFNEEESLDNYYKRISNVIDKLVSKYDFEIIFTDNFFANSYLSSLLG